MSLERYNEEIGWLVLMQINGIGPAAMREINDKYCILDFISELDEECIQKLDWSNTHKERILKHYVDNKNTIHKKAEQYQLYCRKNNIGTLLPDDDVMQNFINKFKGIPPILFYKGNIHLLNQNIHRAAVVGARRCTREGKENSIAIASQLVSEDVVVVSGMAKGIDAYAHTAALKAGGTTIAVLGNGIDICYPPEHEGLMQTIIEKGLVISQFLPGTMPIQYQFPVRNRLIAGLSEKVYVIEASRNSGTNTTVKFARENSIVVEEM